jgi:sugar phosphate isomerase/epimerase
MRPLRIALQTASLRQPLKKALHTAARLGAGAIEIDARNEVSPEALSGTGLRELRHLLAELELKVAAVAFPTRRGYDVPDELERRIEATKGALRFAYSLGSPLVINRVGRVPAESNGPQWNLLVQSLTDLSNYGQHVGAVVTAQTGSESGADLARLLAALPEGGIGVDLDPAGLIVGGFSPSETIAALGKRILHVHARDAARDFSRGRGVEVPLGRGSSDFPSLLAALSEYDFSGYVTIAREHCDDPQYELGEAVKYLKNLSLG